MKRKEFVGCLGGFLASLYSSGWHEEKWEVEIPGEAYDQEGGKILLEGWTFSQGNNYRYLRKETFPVYGPLHFPTLVYGWELSELRSMAENNNG